MAHKFNSNFNAKDLRRINVENPYRGEYKNKTKHTHHEQPWKASTEGRGRNELRNQAPAPVPHTAHAVGPKNHNTKGDFPNGKGRWNNNKLKNVFRGKTFRRRGKLPYLERALGKLHKYNIGTHNRRMGRLAKIFRLRSNRNRKQERAEMAISDGRLVVRKLQLAFESQDLKHQARKLSYKLYVARAAKAKQLATKTPELTRLWAEQLLLTNSAAQSVKRTAWFSPSARFSFLRLPRASRSLKSNFRRKGYRFAIRKLKRFDLLRPYKRPIFMLLRPRYGWSRRPSFRRDWKKGRWEYVCRIRRRAWSDMTFNRVPARAPSHKRARSYTNTLARRFPRSNTTAGRGLKGRIQYFMPSNKGLYRRWHAGRTKRGFPLPRYTSAQENLDWWEEYVTRPRLKRELEPWGPLDPVYRVLETREGFPSVAGYRRRRRVSLPRLNARRRERPVLLPHPAQHKALSIIRERLGLKLRAFTYDTTNPALWKHQRRLWRRGRIFIKHRVAHGTTARYAFVARQARRLKFFEAKYAVWQGGNFHRLEVPPLFSPTQHLQSQNTVEHAIRRTVNTHPMWREFVYRLTHARHGVGGPAGRVHSFVRKLQNFLALEIGTARALAKLQPPSVQSSTNMWEDEARRCLNAMQSVLGEYGSKKRLLYWQDVLKQYYARRHRYTGQRAQVSQALTYFPVNVLSEKNRLTLKDNAAASIAPAPLLEDEQLKGESFSKSYRFWLNSAQRSMKKTVIAGSNPDYADDGTEAVTDFATTRLRFPAAGRRKASYDRAVRNFYARAAYPQYQRTRRSRFNRIRPTPKGALTSFLPTYEHSARLRLKQRVSRNVQTSRYYNRRWRALLNKRSVQIKNKWSGVAVPVRVEERYGQRALTKRRLDNSEMRAVFNDARAELRAKPTHTSAVLLATGEALLARALRGHRKSKRFTKLRSKLYRRRLPPEQTFPSWFYARRERRKYKRRVHPRRSRYNVSPKKAAASAPFWCADVFDLSTTRKRPRLDMITTTTGESLTWLDRAYYREREFSQGPTIARENTSKRFQKTTAKLIAEEATIQFGLNELDQRQWEAEKRKKIREEQELVKPLPLKPCGIRRRTWVLIRKRAHRGLQRAARRVVNLRTAIYRKRRRAVRRKRLRARTFRRRSGALRKGARARALRRRRAARVRKQLSRITGRRKLLRERLHLPTVSRRLSKRLGKRRRKRFYVKVKGKKGFIRTKCIRVKRSKGLKTKVKRRKTKRLSFRKPQVKHPGVKHLRVLNTRKRLYRYLQSLFSDIAKWEKAQTTPTVPQRKLRLKPYDAAQITQLTARLECTKDWARVYRIASRGTRSFWRALKSLHEIHKQDMLRQTRISALNKLAPAHQIKDARTRAVHAVHSLALFAKLLANYRIRDGLSIEVTPRKAFEGYEGTKSGQSHVNQYAAQLLQEWLTGRAKQLLGFRRENLHRQDIRRGPLLLPSPNSASVLLRGGRVEVARQRSRQFLQTASRLRNNFRARLIKDQLYQDTTISPFTFALPTREKYVSDDEKQRHAAVKRARQLERYRRTSHLTETFTNFVPQLLHMLKNRTNTPKVTSYLSMRRLVTSMYWSLRFYMRRDYSGRRSDLRELNAAQLGALRQQINADATYRRFSSLGEDNMRWRFQRRKLAPRPALSGGALRWLRTFFPRRHAFYLEDEDKFSPLYVTPGRVFRAHPSRNNPGTWRTDSLNDSLEIRLKRLTGMQVRRATSRFEGMLATIKRTPTVFGQGAAARKRSAIGANQGLRTSFFSRPYSTTAHHSAPQRSTLVVNQLAATKRRTAILEDTLADTTAATWHRLVKTGAYARGRESYAPGAGEVGAGALDPRLIRLKSLRSRHYLLRQEAAVSVMNTIHNRQRLQLWMAGRRPTGADQPAYFTPRQNQFQLTSLRSQQASAIDHYRRDARLRRARTLVGTRAAMLHRHVNLRKSLRCYGSARQVRARLLRNRRCAIRQSARIEPCPRSYNHGSVYPAITEQKLPLMLRNANGRRNVKVYARTFSVSHGAFQLLNDVYQKSFVYLRRQGVQLVKRLRKRRRLAWWTVPALHQQKWAAKQVGERKQAKHQPSRATRPQFFSNVLKSRWTGRVLARFRANIRSHWHRALSKRLLSHKVRVATAQAGNYFVSSTRQNRNRLAQMSEELTKRAQKLSENLFARRRDEAWDEITLRWMKKARKLKNWLKFRKLKLKSKKIKWSVLPEPIFKRMRSRLRKLEWREPDERFDRPGLWKAFSFHPKEKRKAPWLEQAMYRRALYSTRRHTYRRYQFPREQKRLKWLQFMRKTIYAPRTDKAYIKKRRWPKIRIYNNRLFRSLFNLRNDRVAMRHFQKLTRRRPKVNGFAHSLRGLADRLDVNLMLLNLAPTVFWARLIATLGVLKVNGEVIRQASYRLRTGDRVEWDLVKLERIRANFQPYRTKSPYARFRVKNSSAGVPANFLYFPQIRVAIYKGLPTMAEIRKNSRLHPVMFKLFKADVSATY